MAIKPGEFRVVRADEDARLVLVVDSPEGDNFSNVMLCSNDIGVKTEADVHLLREETGLKYDIIVETNIAGAVLHTQFGPVLGQVSLNLLEVLDSEDFSSLPVMRTGLPLVDKTDQRWRWKHEELKLMHRLSRQCMAEDFC